MTTGRKMPSTVPQPHYPFFVLWDKTKNNDQRQTEFQEFDLIINSDDVFHLFATSRRVIVVWKMRHFPRGKKNWDDHDHDNDDNQQK